MSIRHRLAAQLLLIRHYCKTFKYFWKNRDRLGGNLFTEEEAEYLPSTLSLQEKPVSRASRWAAAVLIALVAALFIWAIFGRMDIIVNASGEIIPSGRTKKIASMEVASVKALYVEEGQVVRKGDVLIELDPTAAAADQDKAVHNTEMAALQIARSDALIAAIDSLKPPKLSAVPDVSTEKLREAQKHLDGQFQDFRTKLQRIDAMIKNYTQALPLATQQARDYKTLSETHDVPVHAYLDKERARIELEGKLADARNQRAALIAETRRLAFDARTEAEKIIGESQPDIRRALFHRKLLTLVAPVDGTVQQLQVHTIGGVVPAAQPLMLIVPREHQLEVEAMVLNKDIGFVKEGQTAAIKVDAFPYTKYGLVPGRVIHISRDAINDEKKGLVYKVKVGLDEDSILVDGRDTKLGVGMAVNVDIKTGDRRVIEYVLSPLLQLHHESLRER
jgi:membrane fusion protein, hemolysin D